MSDDPTRTDRYLDAMLDQAEATRELAVAVALYNERSAGVAEAVRELAEEKAAIAIELRRQNDHAAADLKAASDESERRTLAARTLANLSSTVLELAEKPGIGWAFAAVAGGSGLIGGLFHWLLTVWTAHAP